MCTLALAFSAIGTGLSVFGSMQQGAQQSSSYKYQAAQSAADATAAKGAAQVRADKIRKAGVLNQSQARASLAGSGVDVDAGTSVEINRKIGENTEQDALTEILDGSNKAARLNQTADANNVSASNARSAGNLNAASSFISGAGVVAKGWKTASSDVGVQ